MAKKPFVYTLISFACPVKTVAAVLVYQSIDHADFWNKWTPEYSAAGAMMAFAEFITNCVPPSDCVKMPMFTGFANIMIRILRTYEDIVGIMQFALTSLFRHTFSFGIFHCDQQTNT